MSDPTPTRLAGVALVAAASGLLVSPSELIVLVDPLNESTPAATGNSQVVEVPLSPGWGSTRLILSLNGDGLVTGANWFAWAGLVLHELSHCYRLLNVELGVAADTFASGLIETIGQNGPGVIETYLHTESAHQQRGAPCVQLSVRSVATHYCPAPEIG